jgi:hypothetical protein
MFPFQKSLAIFFLIILFSSSAQSQKKNNFFRLGIRQIDLIGDFPLKNNHQFLPAIDFGFGKSYSLGTNLSFEPELHFSPRGYRSAFQVNDSVSVTSKIAIQYLDFSPNLSFTLGKKGLSRKPLNVWIGPYIGYGLSGKSTYESTGQRKSKSDTIITSTTFPLGTNLSRLDYGINAGVGLRFENFVNFGITYSQGFNNIADNRIYGTIYNQSWGIYLSVLFDDMF